MAKKRRTRRKGSGGKSFQKQAQELMIGGAIYGYATEGGSEMSASVNSMLQKAPTIGNRDITNGIVLYFVNKHTLKNKHVKNAALAALVTGATQFGRKGFSLSGEGLAGWDEAIDVTEEGEELSGVMD